MTDSPRRGPGRLVLLIVSVLLLVALVPTPAHAQQDAGPVEVYFPLTGHHLSMEFLDFWRNNGDIAMFGYPITEEFDENGLTVQYFERAIFERHPDAAEGWEVQLRRLGADLTTDRQDEVPFRPIAGAGDDDVTTFFPQTGHRLSHGFRAYWQDNGGLRVFGYPISEEFVEGGFTVQYFERARFEWHPEHRGTPYEILLGRLGSLAADEAGIDVSPVPRAEGVDDYHPDLWKVAPPPAATPAVQPPAGAPTGEAKWIEINLSGQYLRAWEYDRAVYFTYVSTGTWRTPTPAGTFRVYSKILSHTMSGGTPGIDYYSLPNVPHSMYFYGAYAIHGAYWHNEFGTPRSYGCVNLPLGAAEWLYNWTPIGTVVWIHY